MLRFLYAGLLGIVGAAIIHILVVLLVPTYSDQNAWSQISKLGEPHKFHDLSKLQRLTASSDPYFIEAACRFELADQAIHVHAEGLLPFWSVSIYNRQGDNLFNFNDTISADGDLDLIISPLSLASALKTSLAEAQSHSVLIEQDILEGIVTLRGLVPDASWQELGRQTLAGASCTPL
ncbi:hypothetical protein ACI0FM_04800 [Paenochrobactrum sp. BZR 588]|uniref:DUF1254 domain-containing protein n=1 Tax=Paenochrobactrum TaxID=999488 RepID=UPI0035BC1E4C